MVATPAADSPTTEVPARRPRGHVISMRLDSLKFCSTLQGAELRVDRQGNRDIEGDGLRFQEARAVKVEYR